MVCKVCGSENENGLAFCTVCGAELPEDDLFEQDDFGYDGGVMPPAEYKDNLGLASLILSIVSIVCCGGGGALAIAAIITGIIGKKKAAEAGSPSKLGLIGMIIGIVSIVIGMIVGAVYGIIGAAGAMSEAYYYY